MSNAEQMEWAAAEEQPETAAEQAQAETENAAEAAELTEEEVQFQAFLQEVQKQAEEKDALEQKFLRLQADFDNYRRRSAKQTEEAGNNALAQFIGGLLPVLDNFDRALCSMNDELPEKTGVEMISRQLWTVLEQAGVQMITALGAEFDPNFHEAVQQVAAGEENSGKVVNELQRGYLFGDKLLRPSMVQVGE